MIVFQIIGLYLFFSIITCFLYMVAEKRILVLRCDDRDNYWIIAFLAFIFWPIGWVAAFLAAPFFAIVRIMNGLDTLARKVTK